MDVTALVQRYGSVPANLQKEADEIWSHLQKQSEHVISAKVTSNFGVDVENTAVRPGKVHKGVVVTLKPEYTLSAKDSWVHPNLYQCRALFEGGNMPRDLDLSDTNDLVGRCAVQSVNEIGDTQSEYFTVVDMHLKVQANSVRDSWNGRTVQSVYSTELKDETLAKVREVAESCGADRLVKKSFTNALFRGPNTFHFYNNAYKDAGLVLNSPLTGYTMVESKDHAADYLGDGSVQVNQLGEEQQRSLFRKVRWNSSYLINTFAMRRTFAKTPAVYRMKQARVSTTPILHSLSPQQILELTPTTEHLDRNEIGYHTHYDNDRLEIPVSSEVILKLVGMRDEYSILNKDFYKQGAGGIEGQLVLPRDIVERL